VTASSNTLSRCCSPKSSPAHRAAVATVVVLLALAFGAVFASPSGAQLDPLPGSEIDEIEPIAPFVVTDTPTSPEPSTIDALNDLSIGVDTGDSIESQPLTIVLVLTVVALAPTLLVLLTSFTRIIVVLGITRNALSLQGIPPNQVLIGLALFLSIFVMAPVLSEVNDEALQPMLDGELTEGEAFDVGLAPFKNFMLGQVREADLDAFIQMSGDEAESVDEVSMTTLIPAFVMSELRAGFIIGFLVFVPFLVIDIVVSATLMSMGMVMLPPVVISLPFKLLLFVIVDGWALLLPTLVASFST
jgi:flagellar biosynthesis protein FliP